MGMLDRYRKPGGFVQLLALVESCGPAKQEKFLELIRAEDARWAEHIRLKMLDINRIYSWNDDTLAEIIGTLQDLTVAVAIFGASEPVRVRINSYLSHSRKRKIEDLSAKSPSNAEITSTNVKIIETVRKMSNDGHLRFEKFDDGLLIEDQIEDVLNKSNLAAAQSASAPTSSNDFKIEYEDGGAEAASGSAPVPAASPAPTEAPSLELAALKKKLDAVSKENAVLRHELNVARGKLDQIKKIA